MPRLIDIVPELKHQKFGLRKTTNAKNLMANRRSQADILRQKHLIRLPIIGGQRICYVVSPGYWGRFHYDEIPENAFVIVVNYAIRISAWCRENGIRELKPAIWLCADRNLLTHCKWFLEELEKIVDSGYPLTIDNIRAGGPVIPVFDSGILASALPVVKVTFTHGRSMMRRKPKPVPDRLRAGLTISCQAVQLAYWLGANEIRICGIDMFGDVYFDENRTNVPSRRNRPWPQTKHFNKYIDWMCLNGINVVSLSRTSLRVSQPETDDFPSSS